MLLSRALIDEEAEDSPVRIDPFSMTVDKRRHARCALLCSKVMIYSNIRMQTGGAVMTTTPVFPRSRGSGSHERVSVMACSSTCCVGRGLFTLLNRPDLIQLQ